MVRRAGLVFSSRLLPGRGWWRYVFSIIISWLCLGDATGVVNSFIRENNSPSSFSWTSVTVLESVYQTQFLMDITGHNNSNLIYNFCRSANGPYDKAVFLAPLDKPEPGSTGIGNHNSARISLIYRLRFR